jgi:RHS repeat-associated protein
MFGLINMNGRLYDPVLGRMLSPDPYVADGTYSQDFNRYSYARNNPLSYTDPSGEFIFSLFVPVVGVFLDAACWGAVIGGASYTASVAMSSGGFNNWNSNDFWKSMGWGAVSGAVTFGIGEGFSAMGNFAGNFGTEALRGVAHGLAQGGISELQGGDFWQGFTSGTLGSWAGSGYSALGLDETLGTAGMLGFGALSGGIGAAATGGDFWQGAGIGLMTAGLNHAQHKVEKYKFYHMLKRHYRNNNGADFRITRRELIYLSENGQIGKMKDIGDGISQASIDFYGSSLDLKLSFGRATIYYKNGKPYDFYDYYDFDPKPWGTRSYPAEIATRYGNTLNGSPFHIYLGQRFFGK